MQLAVFDLDGTITRSDTLLHYLLGYLGSNPMRCFRLLFALPTAVLYAVGLSDRGALKASVIRSVLGGSSREEIERWNQRWVPRILERDVFQQARARIATHRAAGDILVLMSASPDLYVPLVGRHLGFDEVICTGIRWNGPLLHGALTTPNCRGEEKRYRLNALRERHPDIGCVAYGNSASDLCHLRLADRGVLINGDRGTCEQARRLHVFCEQWT